MCKTMCILIQYIKRNYVNNTKIKLKLKNIADRGQVIGKNKNQIFFCKKTLLNLIRLQKRI